MGGLKEGAMHGKQFKIYFNWVILNKGELASIFNIPNYGNTGLVPNVCFIIFILNPLIEPCLLYCNDKLPSHRATTVQFGRCSPAGQPGICGRESDRKNWSYNGLVTFRLQTWKMSSVQLAEFLELKALLKNSSQKKHNILRSSQFSKRQSYYSLFS